ncbi:MAG: MATE family efflux transporter [Pseudomonadota bacterium]|nr:MATE family efflux transporter [Pseudomonadota bacterium]
MMRASTHNNHTSWRHIWRLAWPIIISNITVPLVGAVDVAMMGRIDDPAFIGGVGLGMMLFNAIYFGMGFLRMGTTGLVAQSQGEDAAAQIARIMVRGLVLACAIGMIIILATPVITSIATVVFSASEFVESLMVDYATIRLFAAPAALGNMVVLGVLYGRQQMFGGMLLLLIVNAINLILDFVFVLGLGMTVSGVALASVIAQWSGFLFMMWYINRPGSPIGIGRFLHTALFLSALRDRMAYRRFFVLGRDIFIRTALLVFCEALVLNQAAKLGDLDLATCQLVLTLFGILAFALDAFAYAAEALVGEAIGKRNSTDLQIVIRRTNSLAAGMALGIAAILWLGDTVIIRLFTTQAALIAHAQTHWVWACLLAPASFMAFQLDGIFVGATRGQDMRNAMIFSAGGLGIALLLLAPWGLQGLLAAFVGYLGLRGASLWWHINRVYAQAGRPLQQQ